jgi:hypothetical protein
MVTMSVASGMTATMSVLTRELKFSERPEALNGYYASAFAVSALKPAWAWASDKTQRCRRGRRGRRSGLFVPVPPVAHDAVHR